MSEFGRRLEELERNGLAEPLNAGGFLLLASLTIVVPVAMLLAGWVWL